MKSKWNVYSFEKVCSKIYSGGTPSTKNPDYWKGNINWLSSGETRQRFIYKTERKISKLGVEKSSTKLAHKGCTIVASAGQGFTRGQSSYLMIDTYINQSIIVFEANKLIILPLYLYYNLVTRYEEFRLLSDGTSTRGGLSGWIVKRMEIKLPNLKTQKKISSILSSLDDKIELNNKINQNLEEMAQAIFEDMFPKISNGNCKIGDIIIPQRGKGLLSKNAVCGKVPVVAGGLNAATYHNVANTKPPVLTISGSGANAGFVNLWQIPVWSSDSSFIDIKMTPNVYFWYILLKKRQKEIFDSQTGSAQPHIYPKHIAMMPINEVEDIAVSCYTNWVKPLFEMIAVNMKEITNLCSIRDTLLPKLMSGELDVSNINFG